MMVHMISVVRWDEMTVQVLVLRLFQTSLLSVTISRPLVHNYGRWVNKWQTQLEFLKLKQKAMRLRHLHLKI